MASAAWKRIGLASVARARHLKGSVHRQRCPTPIEVLQVQMFLANDEEVHTDQAMGND